jgi:hypothetical protein
MPNEFIIKNGYISKGNSIVEGNLNLSGVTITPNRIAFRVYGSGTTNNLTTTQNGDGTLNGNNFAVDFQQGSDLNTTTGGSTIVKLSVGDTLKIKVVAGEINFDINDNWSIVYIG